MAPKPSDLATLAATLNRSSIAPGTIFKVGDVDASGNVTVVEYDEAGNIVEELSDEDADTMARSGKDYGYVAVPEDQDEDVDPDTMYRTFTNQPIALIGVPTADGRRFASDIDLTFRTPPIPLMWCKQNAGGHDMSYTVGVIEEGKIEGDQVLGSGYLLNSEEADECATQIAHGVCNPSVDLADADYIYTDADGNEIEDMWDVIFGDEEYFVTFTKAMIIGTTMVSTPAFDTRFELDPERSSREVAIVASVATLFTPAVYDHRLFEDPKLSAPTLPSYDVKTGRVFGHIALFGQCHRGIQDDCTIVPRSPSNYREFHTSPSLLLDDGSNLPLGRLTVGTGHAATRLGAGPAIAHYDNTGTCFALVRAFEDKFGIAFSGVVAPGASPEKIQEGLAAPLSGDWRDRGMGRDLIAALAVNTPGFNVRGYDDENGRPMTLVAAGRLSPTKTKRGGNTLSAAQIADVVVSAVDQALDRREQAVAAKATADTALARARKVTADARTAVFDRARKMLTGDNVPSGDAPHANPTNKDPNMPDCSTPKPGDANDSTRQGRRPMKGKS